MQYCSLEHRTLRLSLVTSTTGSCFCFGSIPSFFLELFFYWSPVAYGAPTDVGSSSFSILPFCLFILFMGFSRQECWRGLPFPSPVHHILSDLSTMTHPSWVAPRAWLSFIELDKAGVLVWLNCLVFCDYGFSVFALWCPLTTPTILLGFLLPWMWGTSSRLLQQSTATAPYLGRGVSPHRCPFWLWTWNWSSRPSCTHAATAPWRWGFSSWPLPLASDAAPGLGCGVAPLGCRPWPRTWSSSSRPPLLTLDMG